MTLCDRLSPVLLAGRLASRSAPEGPRRLARLDGASVAELRPKPLFAASLARSNSPDSVVRNPDRPGYRRVRSGGSSPCARAKPRRNSPGVEASRPALLSSLRPPASNRCAWPWVPPTALANSAGSSRPRCSSPRRSSAHLHPSAEGAPHRAAPRSPRASGIRSARCPRPWLRG
jgi:hypothetical protein